VDGAREHLSVALVLAEAYGNPIRDAEMLDAVAEVLEAHRDHPRSAVRLAAIVTLSDG
jgi:hypothetical protein